MEIINKKITELKPYENNPRLNDDAVPYVANSISSFGFKVPIVIDKNNVIITGHTRLKAAKELGMKEVPCIIADDLTDEQVKAFRLADNKVAELADWNFDLLDDEIADILELDMEDFGFELEDDWEEPKVNERQRTYDGYNLDEYDSDRVDGFYQMPIIKRCNHVPNDLISFNYVLNTDAFDKGVHFYIDDYQFERIWNEPFKYMDRLAQFDCVLSPDFSLYMDMPIAMQIWNIYRSRLVGQMMQDYGIKVIPTLSWSNTDSFQFCFDGIEAGGVVSVSTIGVKLDKDAGDIWRAGMDEAIKRLDPSLIICYGGKINYNFGNIEVKYISNHNTDRMK